MRHLIDVRKMYVVGEGVHVLRFVVAIEAPLARRLSLCAGGGAGPATVFSKWSKRCSHMRNTVLAYGLSAT